MSPSLVHMIDHTAERHPQREAFRFLDQSLTYSALVERADRLAAALRALGVARGDRVGLYVNKSMECAVGIYGIMKAGAAYVPLDPAAPPLRTKSVIEQCGIRMLVSHPPRAASIQTLIDIGCAFRAVIGLETLDGQGVETLSWDEIVAAGAHKAFGPPPSSDDLAYIIFTSGSTGLPKGIVHTHRSAMAYAETAAALYGITSEDRLGNHSPLHFDMSTFDYFCGPLVGARTTIISEPHMKMPASLSQLIEADGLTVWYSVPHALIQLLQHGALEKRNFETLRWVLFGGEPFPPKHLRALMKRLPRAGFSNVYGPAEVNQCTYHNLPADWADRPADDGASIPLGRFWPAAEGLVVNETEKPVEPGEAGELVVRTRTMMRGYWSRPDLDRDAFFVGSGKDQGGSIAEMNVYYRTGDIVREGADGLLYFLGRKNRQIKVRGYRVELDEIETVLSEIDSVEEAAAFTVEDADGTRHINAAVTLIDKSTSAAAMLRHVAEHLPTYAVPDRIIIMDAFPRTTSDKIDRRALQKVTQ